MADSTEELIRMAVKEADGELSEDQLAEVKEHMNAYRDNLKAKADDSLRHMLWSMYLQTATIALLRAYIESGDNPDKAREEFISGWEEACEKRIAETRKQEARVDDSDLDKRINAFIPSEEELAMRREGIIEEIAVKIRQSLTVTK